MTKDDLYKIILIQRSLCSRRTDLEDSLFTMPFNYVNLEISVTGLIETQINEMMKPGLTKEGRLIPLSGSPKNIVEPCQDLYRQAPDISQYCINLQYYGQYKRNYYHRELPLPDVTMVILISLYGYYNLTFYYRGKYPWNSFLCGQGKPGRR